MKNSSETKTLLLGEEYDSKLRIALSHAIRCLGALPSDNWQAIGGSQEVERLIILVDGEEITVEAETYIGLTLTGPTAVVDKIAALVRGQVAGGGEQSTR